MGVEVELEGAEAADDVLRRIGPVDPHDELFRTVGEYLALGTQYRLALRELDELRRVHGDRAR